MDALNFALWIAQIVLALSFLFHGWAMLSPRESMRERMGYVFAISPGFRSFIGASEILAAAGLILTGLTGVLPLMTPLAAGGLVVVMISAIVFHVRRNELPNIVLNLILMLLALFVAYGRWAFVPLS